MEAGQRLRVVVSSTDEAYAVPADPRTYTVSLAGDAALVVPTPGAEQVTLARSGPDVPPALLAGVPLLLAALVSAGFAMSKRKGVRS